MSKLIRFLRLPARRRDLLVEATAWLVLVSLGLAWIPFDRLRRWVAAQSGPRLSDDGLVWTREIAWSVVTSARQMPRANMCLPRALATQIMLLRRGLPAELKLGVRSGTPEGFVAHAWVVSGDRIVMGELEDLSGFASLLLPL